MSGMVDTSRIAAKKYHEIQTALQTGVPRIAEIMQHFTERVPRNRPVGFNACSGGMHQADRPTP